MANGEHGESRSSGWDENRPRQTPIGSNFPGRSQDLGSDFRQSSIDEAGGGKRSKVIIIRSKVIYTHAYPVGNICFIGVKMCKNWGILFPPLAHV